MKGKIAGKQASKEDKDRRSIIDCKNCLKKNTRHNGHGWCSSCYSRWCKNGKPEGGPPPPKERKEWLNLEGLRKHDKYRVEYWASVREEYFYFREEFGMSRGEATARIGIHGSTALRWEREAKNEDLAD